MKVEYVIRKELKKMIDEGKLDRDVTLDCLENIGITDVDPKNVSTAFPKRYYPVLELSDTDLVKLGQYWHDEAEKRMKALNSAFGEVVSM